VCTYPGADGAEVKSVAKLYSMWRAAKEQFERRISVSKGSAAGTNTKGTGAASVTALQIKAKKQIQKRPPKAYGGRYMSE
jgi:hypothetical protein